MPVRSVSKLALLMVAATLGVHGARALLVLGSGADRALATHGHGNLGPAVAAVVIGVALLLALLLSRAAGAVAVRGRRRSVLRRLWPAATVALLALYGGQELLQGWTTSGHPAGLDALLADGGWVAIPAALGLGLMIA